MLNLQDELNQLLISPDWFVNPDPKIDFQLAFCQEASEGIDHFNWKWWAKSPKQVDYAQVQLEMIDCIHFLLSHALRQAYRHNAHMGTFDPAEAHKLFMDNLVPRLTDSFSQEAADELQEDLTNEPVEIDQIYISAFSQARQLMSNGDFGQALFVLVSSLQLFGMTPDQIFTTYVNKLTLNKFRNLHGYADGTYTKVWSGQEDNVYLAQIAQTRDPQHPDYAVSLYSALEAEYAKHV